VLHHRGLVNNGHHFFHRMGVQPGDTYLTQMPLFHTAGSVMSMMGCVGYAVHTGAGRTIRSGVGVGAV
jgi:fatty-acyl-CoA synthase